MNEKEKEIQENKTIALLRENYNLLLKNIRSLQDVKEIQETIDKEIIKLDEVKKQIQELQGGIPAKVEVINQPEQKEFPKEIEVKNFPEQKEFPKSFEISNLENIKIPEFPKKIETEDKGFIGTIKELGIIKGFLAKISEKINNFKQIDSVFIRNKTTDEAIPVKLADKDGKRFYNAIASAISAGSPDVIKIGTPAGDSAMDETNDALRVNVVAGGAGDGAILDGVTSSIKATVHDYTNSNPLAVVLKDTNGDYVSVGGGTQYADGAVRGTATGTIAMGDDGTNIQSLKVDADGHPQVDVLTMPTVAVTGTFWQATQPVSAASLPLPTDAATQTTLALIKAKTDNIPALGQALAAASVPIVLTAAQETALTPPAAITGFATSAKQDTLLTELQLKADLTETQPVSLASVPSHAVTNAGTFAVQADTELTTADLDTGAGTDTRAVVGLVGSASGGGALIPGSATDGLLVNLGTNNDVVVSATDLDIRNLTNVDVVTAELSAVDNAVLDVIAAKDFATQTTLAAINAKLVTGTVIGDVNLGATDNAVLDAIAASVAAATPAGTNAIGKLLQPDIDVTTNTNYVKKYYTSAGAVTDGIIWSPAAGKRWHIHTLYLNVSAAATVTLEDDLAAGDSAIWKGELAANSGVILTFPEKYPWASGEDAADLLITTSAGNVYVSCSGFEI